MSRAIAGRIGDLMKVVSTPSLSTLHALSSARPALAMLAASSTTAPLQPLKAEHLIWEPGFGARLVVSLAACGAFAWFAMQSSEMWIFGMQLQSDITHRLMQLAHRLEWWSALGLLSSSCCVLQLLLNAMSFGCAGFNTVLGPVRPQMMAVTISLQLFMWHTTLTARVASRIWSAVAASVLTSALMYAIVSSLDAAACNRPLPRVPLLAVHPLTAPCRLAYQVPARDPASLGPPLTTAGGVDANGG